MAYLGYYATTVGCDEKIVKNNIRNKKTLIESSNSWNCFNHFKKFTIQDSALPEAAD